MKMKKNRISGILLSLALMVGLLSGMSLTAYADDPYAGIKNTTTVIHFDNKDWYLIDYDSSTVTLLSKEAVALSKYNYSDTYVEYNHSDVKTVVDNWYNANISAKADTAVDAVSGNKMFLLTTEQAQAIEAVNGEVLKCPNYQGENMWWLCSPGNDGLGYKAAQVNGFTGLVIPNGSPVHLLDSLVRPALKLNLSKVIFSSESNTFYPIAAVNLTGGANATTSGGATGQTGLTGAMTTVTYTANTGYQFPATSDLYTTTSGITVERTSDTVATVSGTPTDIEVNVTVPDAEAKTYALTLDNQGATKPGANSVTATYDAVLPSIADNLPSKTGYTFDGYFSEKNGGGKQYLKADGTPTEEKWTKDDGGTLYAGWTQKPEANVKEAPKAKDLTYNGKAQELVTEGEAEGGTMQYAVGKDASTAPTDGWSEKIPTGTEAGTYYVWYKVTGDGSHRDTAPSSVTVTIAEEDKPDEPEREAEKPVLIKATSDAISVKTEEGVEYSVDGGNNWNATGIFTDLQPDTEYSIIARYAASGGKEAGKPSEALTVRTLKIVEKTVSTKTLKVSDNEISIATVLLSEESNDGEAYSVGQVEIPDDVAVSLFNSLSEEEQQRVAKGEKFTISISVKESIIDMENKKLKDNKEKADKEIKEKTGGTVEATGMMLDIGLLVQVGDSEKKKTEPAQGSGKITFTVTVPVEMKNTDSSITRTYYLIHILDDGTVEIVNSGTGTEIPAETDSFSYWYLTYVDEKKESGKEEEEKKKDDNTGNNGNTSTEKVITVSDNQPMAYSEETKGDFRIGYCHEIPFFGKAKPELKLFGDIKVIYDGKEYKATKIKVNKNKGLIRITGLDNADKDIVKAVKTATKGSNGLSFKVNPYYVKDTDTVTPKFKKDGSLKSVKVRIQGKDYKAKKGEFSYDQATKTVVFDGNNLKGSCKLS